MPSFIPRSRIELTELAILIYFVLSARIQIVINFHDCTLVTTPIAIIRRREDSDNHTIMLPLVSFHDQLMRPCNEMQTVNLSKLLSDVLAEGVSCSTGRYTPTTSLQGSKRTIFSWKKKNISCISLTSSGSDQTKSHIGPS